jgi:hypothetical protein
LKYANGPLEEALFDLCVRRGLPRARLNVRVHGIFVDVYWPDARLVVELDSEKATPARRGAVVIVATTSRCAVAV